MIEVRGLSKRYGPTVAVDRLSFDVRPGVVTGFLGPNGSGKSTTMRLILGLDRPDAGQARIGGRRYRELRWPLREVGALLEAQGVPPGPQRPSPPAALAASNGDPAVPGGGGARRRRPGRRAAAGGRGSSPSAWRQRLGIAAALLGDPAVLLLDEPVNGLDPEGIRWIRDLLRSLAAEGRTVFVSSHLISEMALTAEQLVVIGRGRLLADTSVAELSARSASLEDAFFELTAGSAEYRGGSDSERQHEEGRHDDRRVGDRAPAGHYRFRRWPGWSGSSCAACARPGGRWSITVAGAVGIAVAVGAQHQGRVRRPDQQRARRRGPRACSLIGVLGVLVMTGEYSSGMIRATLAAVPNRPLVLAAKAAVFGAVGAGGRGGRRRSSPSSPAAAALPAGSRRPSLGQPGVLRAVVLTGAGFCLIGLIGLGLGAIVRHTAGRHRRARRRRVRGRAVHRRASTAPLIGVHADLDRGELAERGPAAWPTTQRPLPVAVGRARHALPVRRRSRWRPAHGCWPGGMPERDGRMSAHGRHGSRVTSMSALAAVPRCGRRSPGGPATSCCSAWPASWSAWPSVARRVVALLVPGTGPVESSVPSLVVAGAAAAAALATGLGRRLGAVHRRLADTAARRAGPGAAGPPPARGALGRLGAGLARRRRLAGRGVPLLKVPVAVAEGCTPSFLWVAGLANLSYPFWWGLFRNHPPGVRLSPVPAGTPFPGRVLHISTLPGHVPRLRRRRGHGCWPRPG